MSSAPSTARLRLVALGCAGFVALMVGVAYAAVPLYELFCEVTGYGGTPKRAEVNTTTLSDRRMTVRFDANNHKNANLAFEPLEASISLRLGETKTIRYRITNSGTTPASAHAGFNVAPAMAGVYFNKIDCFCFETQTIGAGESLDLPVTFYLDPALDEDKNLVTTEAITLSYTLYPGDEPDPGNELARSNTNTHGRQAKTN